MSQNSTTDFADQLLGWYDQNRRSLPWRAEGSARPDPYLVWLSEIMLQQTTVATVKNRFNRFLATWPTVQALAAADQADVLSAWAGLGYYARARNLHKCARTVAHELDGAFPSTAKALEKLPGVGAYTASAVAAIAFGESVAVVDANVERIISRTERISTPLPGAKKAIYAALEPLVPATRPGDFAQALMDLGASICSPRSPACERCPVQRFCGACGAGDMERYPVKPAIKTRPVRRITAFALLRGDTVLLQRRPERGLLGGTLGLPSTPWQEADDFPGDNTVKAHAPLDAAWQEAGTAPRHTFTHFHLETRLLRAHLNEEISLDGFEWHKNTDALAASLPTVFRKMLLTLKKG